MAAWIVVIIVNLQWLAYVILFMRIRRRVDRLTEMVINLGHVVNSDAELDKLVAKFTTLSQGPRLVP
jgi:ubiquinone biosynthesis protein Coq4